MKLNLLWFLTLAYFVPQLLFANGGGPNAPFAIHHSPITIQNDGVKLYIIAVGVTDYGNEKRNLEYPANDVKELVELFLQQPNYKVVIDTLINSAATTTNIKKSFDRVSARIRENDLFLFYYSGHGHNFELELFRFNATQPETILRKDTLAHWIGDLKGGKMILLDACHSYSIIDPSVNAAYPESNISRGGGVDINPDTLEKNLSDILFQTMRPQKIYFAGASSFSNVESFEEKYIFKKHGIFTQALIDCLRGYESLPAPNTGAVFKPDKNNDGFISFEEMEDYVTNAVQIYSLWEHEKDPRVREQRPRWIKSLPYGDFPAFSLLRQEGKRPTTAYIEDRQSGVERQTIGGKKGDGPDFAIFRRIPRGSFKRKDSKGQEQLVVLERDYFMMETEVIQNVWTRFMKTRPSALTQCDSCPVTNVSWEDVQGFLDTLHAHYPGNIFRLPTEAEWEHAARFGDSTAHRFCGSDKPLQVAWIRDNAKDHPCQVQKLSPNKRGLYDMTGNVMEWCQDYYADILTSPHMTNPTGPKEAKKKILRGGAYNCTPRQAELSHRLGANPKQGYPFVGFRLIIEY